MSILRVITALALSSTVALAQGSKPSAEASTTLPIVFTRTVSADHAHIGDAVSAKTTQVVRLASGTIVPSGASVVGHVIAASGFVYDKTPYAHQRQSVLSIQFDSVQVAGAVLPLGVMVRAMADPLTSWDARKPQASDMAPLGTMTQIGGDQLTPSQSEVVNMDGDVVAYNKRGGVYAHLIANGRCDGGSVEVPVGIYSASACGLYGFTNVSAEEMGSTARPSTLTLISSRTSPKVWKSSTALLEVLPGQQNVASR
jgi:hypothetical protein